MIWLLWVPVVVYFTFKSLWFGHYKPDDALEYGMTFFLGIVITFIGGVLPAMGVAAFCGIFFQSKPVEISRFKLTSIRDKDGVTGQFFLGSGFIKSEQYYFYYRQNQDGSVTPDSLRAGQGVRVYEENRKDAEIVNFEWIVKSNLASIIAMPVNSGEWSHKIYVPKGTIRSGYTM